MNIDVNTDNGGRRNGIERRQFLYSFHIPERRSASDRRNNVDRRAARYVNRIQNDRRQQITY